MEQQPKNNVISLCNEAIKKLERQSNLPSSEKLHLLSVLKNHPEVFLHGKEVGNEGMESMVDVVIDGDTEVLYYALLLQDPRVHKWDGQGEEPPKPWVNTNHPKVQAAQQRIDTSSLGAVEKEGKVLDRAMERIWKDAPFERRYKIIQRFLADPSITQWYQASKEPEPDEPYLAVDDPYIFQYLSPEQQAQVRAQVDTYEQAHKERTA